MCHMMHYASAFCETYKLTSITPMKVTLYTWTTDDQNGMNATILTSKGALKAAMLDTIGSTDADRADSMRFAPFGGEAWEQQLEEWRNEQMGDQNYYSWSEQDVEISKPALWPAVVTALERLMQCPDLNLGNLEAESVAAITQAKAALDSHQKALPLFHVMQVPEASCLNVTEEDGKRLLAADAKDVLATFYDGTGHIVHWGDDSSVDDAFPAERWSQAFRDLITHFDRQGYRYLRIDAHAARVAGLPVFDW